MAWQQLHLQCKKTNVDLAEALLLESGALSIMLDDAGDQPLFGATTWRVATMG